MFTHLLKSSTWLFLARLWTQACMALFIVLAARQLGGSGFGEYAFMAALVVIGNMLSTCGTDMHLIRQIARGSPDRQLPAALGLQLALSALLVTAVFFATPFFNFLSPAGAAALRIYSLALFPLAFYTVFTTALRGEQKMGAYAALNIFVASLQLLSGGIFYFAGFDLVGLAVLLLAAQVAAALLAGLLCSTRIPAFWAGWQVSFRDLLMLINDSAPLAWLSVLTILYQRLSPVLLPILAGVAAAGFFSTAARVVEAAKVGHLAIFTALYPAMAQRQSSRENWFQSYRAEWISLLGIAALACLGLLLLSGPLVSWLFGEAFRPSIPVLRILALSILPYTVTNFLNLVFLAEGDERAVTGALSAGLLALAVLTAWWGRSGGPQGAAWAVLNAESLQAALLAFQAVRRLRAAAAVPKEA